MIQVIATIQLNPGKRDAFLDAFGKLVPLVRQEAGCLEYGPNVDVRTDFAAQVDYRDSVVTILEKWESLDALKAHLVAPHMDEYRQAVKELVGNMTLQVVEPA